jgi:lysyl oxidase
MNASMWRRAAAVAGLTALTTGPACGGGGSGGPPLFTGMTPDSIDFQIDRRAMELSLGIVQRDFLAGDCSFIEGSVGATGSRRLLTFDTVIVNWGQYDAHIGDPVDPIPPLVAGDFVYSPCHDHHHFTDFIRYRLLDGANEVAVGYKQAFCLRDNEAYTPLHSHMYECDNQGISAGWSDVYDHNLDGQWIDITDVPAGDYTLEATVNAAGKIPEVNNLRSNTITVPVTIPAVP